MKKILTTFETAKFLGVSPYTIRLWVIKGLLPAYSTPGGHRRIRLEELDSFLKKNRMPIPEKFFGEKWRALLTGFGKDRNEIRRIKEGMKNFQCLTAGSDAEAGFLMMKANPAIVIADLDSERSSWRDTASIVRRNPELSHIHMLGISGKLTRQLAAASEKAGFYNVLVKPVDPVELKKTVRDIFGRTRF